jgi:hypothetical protein
VRQLLSKLIAGGLSAAVILLWWPSVFPSDTVESWLVRGVVWTLSFELMLHALAPVEEALWRAFAARGVLERPVAAAARIGAGSRRLRAGGRTVLAASALAVPLTLLANAPERPLERAPQAQTVRHVTEVKRIVRVERHRVEVPVPVASAGATSATAAPARRAVPSARRAPAGRPAGTSTPPATSDSPSRTPAATPPRSADPPVATPQQSTGAGPATGTTDTASQPE